MRKNQLNILLKHGDIMTMDFIYKEAPKCEKQYFENHRLFITIRGIEYAIGRKVIELLYKLFQLYSSFFIDSMKDSLKKTITEQLKYLPKVKEDKKEMFEDLIREQRKGLLKLIGPITHLNTVKSMKESYFFFLMEKSILGLITHLKFDVLNGEKIDTFKVTNAANSRELSDYFFDFELIKILKSIGFEENINYLNERIDELEKDTAEQIVPGKINGEEKKQKPINNFKHKEIAIAYFYTKEPIDKNTAPGILKAHSHLTSADKLVASRVTSANQLIKASGNNRTDTMHFNALLEAKRLISLKRDKNALTHIKQAIASFKANRSAKKDAD